MVLKQTRIHVFFGSIVGSDYYAYGPSAEQSLRQSLCIYREHINQNQIWCLNDENTCFLGPSWLLITMPMAPQLSSPSVNHVVFTGNILIRTKYGA